MMIMVVLMMIIISSAFAEREAIFDRLATGYYSSDFIKKSLIGKSQKEKVFQQATFVRLDKAYKEKGLKTPFSVENIQNICSNLRADEIQIKKGDVNSLWNTETKNIENFEVTTEYDGIGWVYHDYKNDVHVALYKGNCLNIVWISERYTYKAPEILELRVVDGVEIKKTNSVIYDTTYIYKTVYLTEEEIYQPLRVRVNYQDQYYPVNNTFNFQMWTPLWAPSYHRQQMGCVVTNYYNNTTNNYYEVPEPDPVDPGGPAPAPRHNDGSPAPAPGHGDEVSGTHRRGNIANGSARITSEPRNDTQKSFQRSSQQARSGNSQRSSVAQRSTQTQQQQSKQNPNQSQARSTQGKGTPNPGYTRSQNKQRSDVAQRSNQAQQQRSQQRYTPPQQRSASQQRSSQTSRSGQPTTSRNNSNPRDYNRTNETQASEGRPREYQPSNNTKSQSSYNNGGSRQNYGSYSRPAQNMGRQQSAPRSSGPSRYSGPSRSRGPSRSSGGGSRGHIK